MMSTGKGTLSLQMFKRLFDKKSFIFMINRAYSLSKVDHRMKPQPMVHHDIEKPTINEENFDPEGIYSENVRSFIRSRQFENNGGRHVAVVSFPDGVPLGMVTLNDFVFGANPRIDIMQRVNVWERAILRAGTASTKDRSEVRGGGRKPRPQKGSGRSRQGSIRAPHWKGGGVCHGPKPKSYFYPLPIKVARMGLRCAFSSRLAQGDLHIIDTFEDVANDIEEVMPFLARHDWKNALLIDRNNNYGLEQLAEKASSLSFSNSHELKVTEILKRNKVLISLSAIRRIEHTFCEENRIITLPEYKIHQMLDKEDQNEFYLEDSTYVAPKKFWQNNKKCQPPARTPPRRR